MNRRDFLRSSAIPAGAALATVGPVFASAAQASPALTALARRLDEAEERYRNAAALHHAALERLLRMAPPRAPEALVITPNSKASDHLRGELETTPDRKLVVPNRRISTVVCLEIEARENGPRTKLGREIRRRLPIARSYEAAMDQAREASGYNEAEKARYWAALALMRLASEAFAIEAQSMADVGIKARAFLAGGYSDRDAPLQLAARHGQALALDVARLAGGQA